MAAYASHKVKITMILRLRSFFNNDSPYLDSVYTSLIDKGIFVKGG